MPNRLPPYKLPDEEMHQGHRVSTATGRCVDYCPACWTKYANITIFLAAFAAGLYILFH